MVSPVDGREQRWASVLLPWVAELRDNSDALKKAIG